jgi:hypothetical protein
VIARLANLVDLDLFPMKILVMLMMLWLVCMATVFKDVKFVLTKLRHVPAVLAVEGEGAASVVTTGRNLFAVSFKRAIANMARLADFPMMVMLVETLVVVIVSGEEVVEMIATATMAEVAEMIVIHATEEIPGEMIHVIAEIPGEMTPVTAETPEEMIAVTPETEEILAEMMIVVTPDVTVTMMTGRVHSLLHSPSLLFYW